jgi:hypothetical protein
MAGDMDLVTIFGLVAVTAMVGFYAAEDRHHLMTLAFGAACGLAAVYGFLIGAWPFALVEAVWMIVAAVRWKKRFAGRL